MTVEGQYSSTLDMQCFVAGPPESPAPGLCSPDLHGEPLESQVSRPGQRGARLVLLSYSRLPLY